MDYIVYPDNTKVLYDYYDMGSLIEMKAKDKANKYKYDRLGRIKEHNLPDGTYRKYEYEYSRLNKLTTFRNNEIIDNREFEYDLTGNKICSRMNGENIHYNYDCLNQLIEDIKPDNKITKYFYDTIGNRRLIEDWDNINKPDVTEYKYDDNEGLIGIKGKRTNIFENEEFSCDGVSMTYDKRGNLIKAVSGSTVLGNLVFDETNKLVEFSKENGKSTNFTYDGLNRRVKVDETDYLCDITKQFNSVLESGDSKYFYGNDILPIQEESRGNYLYYLSDDLGSPVNVFDKFGVVKNYNFDSFRKTDEAGGLFGYTGYQIDKSGLLYGQARYYMPETGRFISEDSYKGKVVDIQSLNLGVYCKNNPLKFIDPSGNVPCGEYEANPNDKFNIGNPIEPKLSFDDDFKYNSKEDATFGDRMSWLKWVLSLMELN